MLRSKFSLRRRVVPCLAVICGLTLVDTSPSQAQQAAAKPARLEIIVRELSNQVPCRIHLKDQADQPVQAGALPFWRDHFVCPGTVQLNLPVGTYAYEIERGPEYARVAGRIEVQTNKSAAINVTLT